MSQQGNESNWPEPHPSIFVRYRLEGTYAKAELVLLSQLGWKREELERHDLDQIRSALDTQTEQQPKAWNAFYFLSRVDDLFHLMRERDENLMRSGSDSIGLILETTIEVGELASIVELDSVLPKNEDVDRALAERVKMLTRKRPFDERKIEKALEYIKSESPIKQLQIATHIDVKTTTFEANYMPELKRRGVIKEDGKYVVS